MEVEFKSCAGAALDPPLWKIMIPYKLSLSLSSQTHSISLSGRWDTGTGSRSPGAPKTGKHPKVVVHPHRFFSTDLDQTLTGWSSDTAGCWVSTSPPGYVNTFSEDCVPTPGLEGGVVSIPRTSVYRKSKWGRRVVRRRRRTKSDCPTTRDRKAALTRQGLSDAP